MLTMLTFRAGKVTALAISLACLAACSREQQDWRSAEATDTVEAYAKFLKQHPDSELVTAARGRFAQLSEDREWSQAGETDTADAYKQFLARYPNGKWAQEARIRIENFSLGAEGSAAPAVTAAANAVAPAVSPPSVAQPYIEGPTHAPTIGATTPSATAPMTAGEAAQIPTSPVAAAPSGSASPSVGVPAPTSPAPPTYPQSAPTQQAPSAISTAWRSADSGSATAYGVQLGAFASENAAASEWDQLTTRFSAQLRGLAPHVVSADTTTGRLFRLQALVADEATARALCDMLRKQSQACVPVLPH
jgi:SPOR domain